MKLLAGIWRTITSLRQIAANLLFLALVVLLVVLYLSREVHPVPGSAALVLDPAGLIVEQKTVIDPMEQLFSPDEDVPRETLLKDILDAIRYARDDDRIKVLILDLSQLRGSSLTSLSKLQEIGRALLEFKSAGKEIYAYATGYDQNQYYLAAHADHVYLQELAYGGGGVQFEGLGVYPTFFRSALDKLKAQIHVFKVGTYKSAVEPYTRDDMSEESKQAFRSLLDVLWSGYKKDIAERRQISVDALDRYIATYDRLLQAAGNDVSKLAVDQGLVDEVITTQEWVDRISALTGKSGKGFDGIAFRDYLPNVRPAIDVPDPTSDKIAILVAKGDILDGKQAPGNIGGASTADLVKQARTDDSIKALVLRVDSGGGSASAAEMIRSELELLKQAGKPLVVSMGSLAASGGYWISAGADRILATPSTITGSIGIFGIIPTFEASAAALGIHVDGVGTEELSGANDPLRPLNPMLERTIQQLVQEGYKRFVNIVADGRHLTPEKVDEIGQGRVWAGSQALDLGLVDGFGDLENAVTEAAELAKIDRYDEIYLEQPLSTRQRILSSLFGDAESFLTTRLLPQGSSKWVRRMGRELSALERMNDPNGIYLQCLSCFGFQ